MPWPVITAHTASCVYQMCESSGHSVCHNFGNYYERLCAAVQKVLDDPTPTNLASLREVMTEETHLVHE